MCKSHKLPFIDSKTQYNKPLELAATDLWGLAPIHTDYGFKYTFPLLMLTLDMCGFIP